MRWTRQRATVLAIGSGVLLAVPSAAQSPIGLKVTFCSKANPNASPITGTLVGNDSTTYYKVFTPDYGEITLRRADVRDCGQRIVCPAGQEPSAAGCTCPANQTMQDGHCASPRPAPAPANAPVAACRNFEDLAVQGSGTVGLGVMPFLIQGFANANGMRVTRSSDSQTQTRTYQLQGTALDAVVVIVNKQNPVNTLGLCQIAEIFAGRIRNWRELGGRPGAINLQVRLGPSGTFETFQTLVLKACGVSASRPRLWSPQT